MCTCAHTLRDARAAAAQLRNGSAGQHLAGTNPSCHVDFHRLTLSKRAHGEGGHRQTHAQSLSTGAMRGPSV